MKRAEGVSEIHDIARHRGHRGIDARRMLAEARTVGVLHALDDRVVDGSVPEVERVHGMACRTQLPGEVEHGGAETLHGMKDDDLCQGIRG
ncbi:hypothetical protein [Luethyella okanaganae]|uniref:Uncharacterized protein n=1 Tax=Luethyella okanaganae TaxID=69372 RepID=A0ABW1VFX6_9MICO